MKPRLDAYKHAPGARPAMSGLETLVRESGLETPLLELVRIRASQMNGCAYCLDMHSKDARAAADVAHAHVPDATYERVRKLFTEARLVNLTMAIVAINGWNRIAISFRMVP
jgi:AhpD family alkylhydroperoxidase